MPIYEYRCEKGHTFDVMQSMSDDPLTACEVCGAPVQKVLHAPAVHFKGSGFYNTDYGRKKGGGNGAASEKGAADSSAGADKKASESKPGESKPAKASASGD